MHKQVAAAALLLALASGANAQTAANSAASSSAASARQEKRAQIDEKREESKTKKDEMQAKRDERVEEKCKNTENRVQTRLKRYENNRRMYENVYGKAQIRFNRLVNLFKENGLDTTTLEKDLATLEEKTQTLYQNHERFMEQLRASQQLACGESDGQFKTKLGEARKVDQTVRQSRLEVKNFIQNTVRKDIQALRAQLEAQTGQEEQETEKSQTEKTEQQEKEKSL